MEFLFLSVEVWMFQNGVCGFGKISMWNFCQFASILSPFSFQKMAGGVGRKIHVEFLSVTFYYDPERANFRLVHRTQLMISRFWAKKRLNRMLDTI